MLPVGPRAPSEVPRREVLGPALRLEGPAVGVHAIGQERGQLSSPRGGVALVASAPPTSSTHASGGGVLPAAEATPPGRSVPARGSLPRPPAGAREGGVSSQPHFARSEGGAIKAAAPSGSAHDPKAHASALGHHVAPGVAETIATGSVEISGGEGGGARVERLVLGKPAEGGRRRAEVKQRPALRSSSTQMTASLSCKQTHHSALIRSSPSTAPMLRCIVGRDRLWKSFRMTVAQMDI